MKFAASCLVILGAAGAKAAFVPGCPTARPRVALKGYLDDLTEELYGPEDNPDVEADLQENTKMKKEDQDRFGPGSWENYVDFEEFDGGDGQMGVAGDGSKGLEKIGSDVTPQLAKSKTMSAKNAWGTSTGYADKLMSERPDMDIARAQQLENWANQQEVRAKNQQLKEMTEAFDEATPSAEEDWRALAKFGVERNEEFDMDETFGEVQAGDLEGVIEVTSRLNQISAYDLSVKNEYMGFADFRASFTPETPSDWTVEPTEGSLTSREPTNFILRFRPNNPGTSEGHLVIETEDFKKTWKLVGSTG
eukprot:CAMPEP_0113543030 /NCGR_PEP_ID=MMETSP0015_2-20120614/9938_1 /TAXON_ID=2838 /ORGANISM="Odontella" /LENGTH=305 /DNA_ID=CAMNT_0000443157 /DNA_START=138 /DNA_END=1055 /DNA_ORIENTATION=- /assembly_acc=CAM_ASM_000160